MHVFTKFRSYLRGMETGFERPLDGKFWRFRSYLRGMETSLTLTFLVGFASSDPTYEAWKPHSKSYLILSYTFRSYLRGMETYKTLLFPQRTQLPFRSYLRGMETCWTKCGDWISYRSDPTYEAWKLNWRGFNLLYLVVPILPTRHGNIAIRLSVCSHPSFRSYLRGMETQMTQNAFLSYLGSDPTYEAWKQFKDIRGDKEEDWVPILPTRHGNSLKTLEAIKRKIGFRSYLRGMETALWLSTYRQWRPSSDPTYEAWKRHSLYGQCARSPKVPILPTRHGNKRKTADVEDIEYGSDPTYEAWKL